MTPTEEMVRVAAEAMAKDFQDRISEHRGLPFTETGVALPAPEIWERYARRALTAALAAMWQDHVIVPREPTADMCECGPLIGEVSDGRTPAITTSQADQVYRAMIAAAPTLLSTRMGSEKTSEG